MLTKGKWYCRQLIDAPDPLWCCFSLVEGMGNVALPATAQDAELMAAAPLLLDFCEEVLTASLYRDDVKANLISKAETLLRRFAPERLLNGNIS